jgi:hypothetical protein
LFVHLTPPPYQMHPVVTGAFYCICFHVCLVATDHTVFFKTYPYSK